MRCDAVRCGAVRRRVLWRGAARYLAFCNGMLSPHSTTPTPTPIPREDPREEIARGGRKGWRVDVGVVECGLYHARRDAVYCGILRNVASSSRAVRWSAAYDAARRNATV